MMKIEFKNKVRSRLPKVADTRDELHVDRSIDACYDEGFSIDDAVAYCRCFEEVNPELDEDFALARMSAIRSKYVTGKGKQ